MKKTIALILALAVLFCSGCSTTQKKIEEIAGTWSATQPDTRDWAKNLLEAMEAYDEELALAELDSLRYALQIHFDEEMNYSFQYDAEGTTACVKQFLRGYFDNLYEGRETLEEAYGMDFADMTQEEFDLFYANLYGYDDMDALIEEFSQDVFDDSAMTEVWKSGTYTIVKDRILLTAEGEENPEQITYSVTENELTLAFADETVVCTRK